MSTLRLDLSPDQCARLPWHDRIAGYEVALTGKREGGRRVGVYGPKDYARATALVRSNLRNGRSARVIVIYRDGSESH